MITRDIIRRMRHDWDRRARENALHYVATGSVEWEDEDFYRSGEETLRLFVLSDLDNICQGRDPKQMRVLEIGCGAGRVTRALAAHFGEVYAVDISAEMVRRARRALRGIGNARIFRNNGKDLSVIDGGHRASIRDKHHPLEFDFAFSCIVFQHIPSRAVIENYACEVHRLLRPGGLFKFQVQGSDTVEPEAGDTWVGAPFTKDDAREMAERCGFEMRYDQGEGEQDYWLWLFKPAKS